MDYFQTLEMYPAIMAKAREMGKVAKNFMNKKLIDQAAQLWARFTPEELAQLNQEISSYPLVAKTSVVTPTAVCYYNLGVFYAIPVRDIVWCYVRLVKESMNFIPTGKQHQIFVMDRTGEQHIVCIARTNGFSKKTPGEENLQYIRSVLNPVRPGIVYGYSNEIEQWFCSNLQAAVAQIDAKTV